MIGQASDHLEPGFTGAVSRSLTPANPPPPSQPSLGCDFLVSYPISVIAVAERNEHGRMMMAKLIDRASAWPLIARSHEGPAAQNCGNRTLGLTLVQIQWVS